jgi:hypothetical protein
MKARGNQGQAWGSAIPEPQDQMPSDELLFVPGLLHRDMFAG